MRIEYKVDGGFGYFPGLSAPRSLDTDDLAPQDAAELAQLIDDAGFFDRPAAVDTAAPESADHRRYTIKVEQDGQAHTVSLTDPITDPKLKALQERLQRLLFRRA